VAVGFRWGGPMTLVDNFVKKGKGNISFVRNKLK
jgi:hypothetical protein